MKESGLVDIIDAFFLSLGEPLTLILSSAIHLLPLTPGSAPLSNPSYSLFRYYFTSHTQTFHLYPCCVLMPFLFRSFTRIPYDFFMYVHAVGR